MDIKFSNITKEMIGFSRHEANRLNHQRIGVEHLLLTIIQMDQNTVLKAFQQFQVDFNTLRTQLENQISLPPGNNKDAVLITKETEQVLKLTKANLLNSTIIQPEHLVLSILHFEQNTTSQTLEKFGITYSKFFTKLQDN